MKDEMVLESPGHVKISLAAAMTLGLKNGLFYRNAKLYCINILLTYKEGCLAKCAYCGLSKNREGDYEDKSFIRVAWPTHELDEIAERIAAKNDRVKRICVSMVTRKRAFEDTLSVCRYLRSKLDTPISVLLSPTVVNDADIMELKTAGVDKVGVAVDLATPELFDRFRGRSVGGPHTWERYWACLENCLSVFGKGMAGAHFMVGMGETEEDMCGAMQRMRDMGGFTHLFSFFPENGSDMDQYSPPPMDQYRRIQLARYLIDNDICRAGEFTFNDAGRLGCFNLEKRALDSVIDTGEPFRTSGCTGKDGQVACNRPYANSRPGPDIRNYPFRPTFEDIERIRMQLADNAETTENVK